MAVRITITSATNISSTLDIYTGATPSTLVLFESGVALLSLQAGYTFTPAANAYYYEVRDTGSCGSVLSLSCSPPATTIAPTTTTIAPTTMAPTTMAPTTMAPTTMAPTTMAPTTMAPTTMAPTTMASTTTTIPCYTVEHPLYYDATDPNIACSGPSAPSGTYYSYDSSIFSDVYTLRETTCSGNDVSNGYYADRVTGVWKAFYQGVITGDDGICGDLTTTTTTTIPCYTVEHPLYYDATDPNIACSGPSAPSGTYYSYDSSIFSDVYTLRETTCSGNDVSNGYYADRVTGVWKAFYQGVITGDDGICGNLTTTTSAPVSPTTTVAPTTTTTKADTTSTTSTTSTTTQALAADTTSTTTIPCYTVEHPLYYDATDPNIACSGPSAPSGTYYSYDSSIFSDVYTLRETTCSGNDVSNGYYADRVTGVWKAFYQGVITGDDGICGNLTTTTTLAPVQNIAIARPLSGNPGTIELCGESLTGSLVDTSTLDYNIFFRSNSVVPSNGQQLYSNVECTTPYSPSVDALWAVKSINAMGVFDYYDLHITISGTAGLTTFFQCSSSTTTTTTLAPVQNIAIARPLSGNPGTIELCGESLTGSLVDTSTLDYNIFFRSNSVVPSNGQQLYSNVECTTPYSPSVDALWAVKSINAMGVFDYYDLHITISGTAGLTTFFQCSSSTTTTTTLAPVQNIAIARPLSGNPGTIELCGESLTGSLVDTSTLDYNIFFRSNSVVPSNGQQLYSNVECTTPYSPSVDALWAVKSINAMGVFDYYDLHITISGTAGLTTFFQCSSSTTTTTTLAPVQNIAIARPLSGNPGTIELCGESLTGSLVDTSTLDYNIFFRSNSVVPSNGQQLYSNVECTTPYSPSVDALWAVKSINAMGVFDYYDLHITISGTAGLTTFFQCS